MYHHTGWVMVKSKNVVDHHVEIAFDGKTLVFEGDFADVYALVESSGNKVPMSQRGKCWSLDLPDHLERYHGVYLQSDLELTIVVAGTDIIFHNKPLATMKMHAVPKPYVAPPSQHQF